MNNLQAIFERPTTKNDKIVFIRSKLLISHQQAAVKSLGRREQYWTQTVCVCVCIKEGNCWSSFHFGGEGLDPAFTEGFTSPLFLRLCRLTGEQSYEQPKSFLFTACSRLHARPEAFRTPSALMSNKNTFIDKNKS